MGLQAHSNLVVPKWPEGLTAHRRPLSPPGSESGPPRSMSCGQEGLERPDLSLPTQGWSWVHL